MHRIDGPSATPSNQFTQGSPTGGVPATVVTADWLNDVQENVSRAVEGAGIPLEKGNFGQLLAAIRALSFGVLPKRDFNLNDLIRIPDMPGGLIVQWGTFTAVTGQTIALNTPFPNKILAIFLEHGFSATGPASHSIGAASLTNFMVYHNVGQAIGFKYLAIGV